MENRNGKYKLYNIVTPDNYVVCNDCTWKEAVGCLLQLTEMDKIDGTYEEGFYRIEAQNVTESEIVNQIRAYADFARMAFGYATTEAESETAFFLGAICNMDRVESIGFIKYILEYWNAYTMDMINGKHRYTYLTRMVYESWTEYNRK